MPDPMVPYQYMVDEFSNETHDTFTLKLSSTNGAPQLDFGPGQFNMLYVHGIGEVPISISGDPVNQDTIVHTIRDVGTVTRALRRLKKNDPVGLRGSFGSCWPVKQAEGKDVLIITGGIGLAPLRPAIYQFLAQRDKIKKFAILYGARTPEDILYRSELEQWRSKLDLQVRVTVDKADDRWFGTVGVVPILIAKARFDPENTLALVCGPEIMMHFTVQELKKQGVSTKNIYVSMERNMKCAIGFCGHCQYGPKFVCKDGPVFLFREIEHLFSLSEV